MAWCVNTTKHILISRYQDAPPFQKGAHLDNLKVIEHGLYFRQISPIRHSGSKHTNKQEP